MEFKNGEQAIIEQRWITADAENYIISKLGTLTFTVLSAELDVSVQTIANRAREFSAVKDWSTYEIIKTYREQDYMEKIFKDIKNTEHFSIRPQYHYTDHKIRIHIFCCLLGLTLVTILQKEMTNKGYNVSKSRLLDNLKQIRECFKKDKVGNKINKTLEQMNELHLYSLLSSLDSIINVVVFPYCLARLIVKYNSTSTKVFMIFNLLLISTI